MGRILIADTPPAVVFLKAIFDEGGHDLVIANTMEVALEKVQKEAFDLIVVGVPFDKGQMVELIHQVKQSSSNAAESIISFSARDGEMTALIKDLKEDPVQAIGEIGRTNVRLLNIANDLKSSNQKLEEMSLILEQARDRALDSSALKSSFLANMSHEMRTPLNAVLGFANLLLGTSMEPHQLEFAKVISSSAEVLRDLISNILDFSKIEAGKLELEEIDFDFFDLVNTSLEIISLTAKEKQLTVEFSKGDDVPRVLRGDPSRIQQVLLNLLGNAVKFTNYGSVSLSVMRDSADEKTVALRFKITDTGIGIPKDKLSTIMTPFTQGDASTTRTFGGTGLGLSIASSLVNLMGGELAVESVFGRGTMFGFTIPLTIPDEATACEIKSTTISMVPPVDGVAEKRRFLVVEDNPVNLKLTVLLLKNLGGETDTAINGKLAVELMTTNCYSVVFMDCQMPEMDGYKATSIIRELELQAGKHTPIIALTANATTDDKKYCIEAGMDDYITKPISLNELKSVIERFAA